MAQTSVKKKKKPMSALERNQLIGGICAILVVAFACVRIFVLKVPPDGIFTSLISISGAVLSLVVLTSAVHVMLMARKTETFETVLAAELDAIDKRYGALIEPSDDDDLDDENGVVYSIADNVDAVFMAEPDPSCGFKYTRKFAFSPNFTKTRRVFFYVSHADVAARATQHGDTLETTARLLARDIAVAIQRSFSDILTAHALEISREEGRAVVTIDIDSTKTAGDAERIAELIDYMLFLHFVAT